MDDNDAARSGRGGRDDSPAWIRDMIFYGIDVARFQDTDGDGRGDLAGVTKKLDYLSELGVTCLWLLPFFPSDRADNGYAITDYVGVDVSFGSIDDFRELTEQAHRRGIRIMLDLVVHHTSSKHPWFQAAESDAHSRYRNYYVWSQEKPPDGESQSVFPQEEDGIWAYSQRANAYYRHRFYTFQPDLQLENDEVWDNVKRILDFWIALGADGFRIDAATLMFTESDEASSIFDERFGDLRRYLSDRAPSIALLGEADVTPGEITRYFRNGRFDLLYNFFANNAVYLALARESAASVIGALNNLREARIEGSMLNFMRNLDELDLERLSAEERDEVFRNFAPEQDMRIYGRGIRRSWASMMHNDDQLRMTMSLLFALPGSPLLMYGQEIGMGDDLSRAGREAVRLPMQWTAESAGGFTRNDHSELAAAAQRDSERGYLRVNVRSQRDEPGSLLALTRDLATLRAKHPQVGTTNWDHVQMPEASLLALRYGEITVIHNFSAKPQSVSALPASRHILGTELEDGALPGYGFAWLLADEE
jgi:maltose alpha-D-glucosyltransferase / alpha-amylase